MKGLFRVVFIICLVTSVSIVWGSADKPEAERTNAPGDPVTCAQCHGNLDTGPGRGIVYAPPLCVPGDTIDLFVEVAHPGQSRWGFEMTVLNESNKFVGQFINVDPNRVDIHFDVTAQRWYAKQTRSGADAGVPNVARGRGAR